MGFAVVTDSTADIPPDVAADHGITVVPLSVTIGADTMPDGAITQSEFFARMAAAPRLPTTSQPPIGQFVEAYERALRNAEEVLSITISAKLSGTFDSARQAAEQFAGRVHVFDSLNLSWGLGFQAVEAAKAAAQGRSVAEALEHIERVRSRVRMIVGLDSLDNLAKGGRIGRVSALFGALLDLKVTLTVDADGAFSPVARTRGEKAALRHTLDWIGSHLSPSGRGRFAVGYAMLPERAEWLAEQIRSRFDAVEVFTYPTGTVIASHTGTGWGVAVLPED
jgi:DegV family protein with EDD domain